jgi:capsular polysaccharide biosynthesis protein
MSLSSYKKKIFEFPNAVITPTTINWENRTFCGCVYDESGMIIRESQRGSPEVAEFTADPEQISVEDVEEYIDGRCLYLGHYTGQYGHFLLESLSRFWVFETNPVFDYVLFSPFVHRTPDPSSFSPADTIFKCFSIKEGQFKLIQKKTRVRQLVLPTHLIDINTLDRLNEEHREVFRKIKNYCRELVPDAPVYSRVYLSRRGWRLGRLATHPIGYGLIKMAAWFLQFKGISVRSLTNRPVVNEAAIERYFTSLGFAIVSPEKLSFPEQVALFSKVDVLVGFDSSAIHNTLFLPKGASVIMISCGGGYGANHRLCNVLAQVEGHFIEFQGKKIDPATGAIKFDLDFLRSQISSIMKKMDSDK